MPVLVYRVHELLHGFGHGASGFRIEVRSQLTMTLPGWSTLWIPVVVSIVALWSETILGHLWLSAGDRSTPSILVLARVVEIRCIIDEDWSRGLL